MFKDDDGIIKGLVDQKDRTLVHQQNEIIIEPSILDWQEAIDKNKGKKDFTVANNMGSAIEKELKAVEKDNAKFDEELNAEKESDTELTTADDYKEAIKETISHHSYPCMTLFHPFLLLLQQSVYHLPRG